MLIDILASYFLFFEEIFIFFYNSNLRNKLIILLKIIY